MSERVIFQPVFVNAPAQSKKWVHLLERNRGRYSGYDAELNSHYVVYACGVASITEPTPADMSDVTCRCCLRRTRQYKGRWEERL